MRTIQVVCGIIFRDGKVLICRRGPDKSLAGYWEFPGGKIEDGESAEECLVRELKEELELLVIVKEHFSTAEHQYDEYCVKLSAFICDYVESEIVMTDHDECVWVGVYELNKWKLATADVVIARALMNMNLSI